VYEGISLKGMPIGSLSPPFFRYFDDFFSSKSELFLEC